MKKIVSFKNILLVILCYVGITALWGGLGLLFLGGNTFDLPEAMLASTPFSSFVIPGFILAFVVGGSSVIAVFLLFKQHHLRFEASAVAGFGLLIWLFAELFMLPEHHVIQIVYFALALSILILTMLLLKSRK